MAPRARAGKRARPGPWIRVGLPESKLFQATVPITAANRLSPPQNFFLEAVQSTNLRAEDRIIDLLRIDVNKQPLACLCACPRSEVTGLAEMLGRLGTRVAVIEPAPMGLLRAAASRAPAPRGSRLCLRFFLGRKQAIGMEVVGHQPLFWHAFDLVPGDESASILAAYSTLWMHGAAQPHRRADRQGVRPRTARPEAHHRRGLFRQRTGARLVRCAGPGPRAGLGGPGGRPEQSPDRGGRARPGPRLQARRPDPRDLPLGRAGPPGGPHGRASPCSSAAPTPTRRRGIGAAAPRLPRSPGSRTRTRRKLDAEKKLLEERIKTIEAFQKTRMDWTAQLRTIAADTPETTVITSLTGDGEAELPGKGSQGKPKKQLVVNFVTPLAEDGAMPGEIDRFLAALRGEPSLLRHFPNIEVSGLRTRHRRQGAPGRWPSTALSAFPRTEPIKGGTAR